MGLDSQIDLLMVKWRTAMLMTKVDTHLARDVVIQTALGASGHSLTNTSPKQNRKLCVIRFPRQKLKGSILDTLKETRVRHWIKILMQSSHKEQNRVDATCRRSFGIRMSVLLWRRIAASSTSPTGLQELVHVYSSNSTPALLSTAHSCSQHGPATAWLTLEWPETLYLLQKYLLCWEYNGVLRVTRQRFLNGQETFGAACVPMTSWLLHPRGKMGQVFWREQYVVLFSTRAVVCSVFIEARVWMETCPNWMTEQVFRASVTSRSHCFISSAPVASYFILWLDIGSRMVTGWLFSKCFLHRPLKCDVWRVPTPCLIRSSAERVRKFLFTTYFVSY